MSATITVLKYELRNDAELLNDISAMSSEVKEITNAYSFSPRPGNLYDLLNYLKQNGVNYRTDFSEISGEE